MDAQTIFNKAFHLTMDQGEPALNALGQCVYRTNNGNKCAVGHLIDDATAGRFGLRAMSRIDPTELPDDLQDHHDLLTAIQRAHDDAQQHPDLFRKDFRDRMAIVAHTFDLEMPQCPT